MAQEPAGSSANLTTNEQISVFMSLGFLREFLRSPSTVGAIWPSSPALAREMVRTARVAEAESVLELGPGSGAFTGEILQSLREGSQFISIEKQPDLARAVALKFPQARVIEGCATRLALHLQEEDFGRPDAILSGLPWAAFPDSLQSAILDQILEMLTDDGVFSTFAYFGPHWLKAGRAFRKRLEASFRDVRRTPVVLANLPPAFVYYCRR